MGIDKGAKDKAKMKIKYIGNFTDGTNWAKSCVYGALNLKYAGYDIHCEEKKYNNLNIVIEPEIEELMPKKSDSYDAVIQHVLPHDYRYYGGVKNIGYLALETLNLSHIPWLKNINFMDEIFVPNRASKECLIKSGIKKPIKILNFSFNYDKTINQNSIANISQLNNNFNFMFYGDLSTKNNLEAVLRAFHLEFNSHEPVNLYIKSDEKIEDIINLSNDVRSKLNIGYRYKKEIILSESVSNEVVISTTKQCHAVVSPSYGEACSYHTLEAMSLGLPVIYTDGIGISDYGLDVINYPVKSQITPCYARRDTIQGIYTSNDKWLEIDVSDLQSQMRKAFTMFIQDNNNFKHNSEMLKMHMKNFDYKNTELARNII